MTTTLWVWLLSVMPLRSRRRPGCDSLWAIVTHFTAACRRLAADGPRDRDTCQLFWVSHGVEVRDLAVYDLDQEHALQVVAAVDDHRWCAVVHSCLDPHVRQLLAEPEDADDRLGHLVRAHHRPASRGCLAAAVGRPRGVRREHREQSLHVASRCGGHELF